MADPRRGAGIPLPVLLLVLPLLCAPPRLAAKGSAEEPPAEPRSGEWVFSLTAFDGSALPDSRKVTAQVLEGTLAGALGRVEYRVRPAPEFAWYENAAWGRSRSEVGKQLAAKHEERSRLLFQGFPEWRYRRDLRALDRDIALLEDSYRAVSAAAPPVVPRPVFRLRQAAAAGGFPSPPPPDRETEFCIRENADAFLSGRVSEYYGRLYLVVRVYARYARSWIYEDASIFSPEDLAAAMDELAARLVTAIEGVAPAAVRIAAEPEEAIIIFKDRFAGRGGGGGIIETAPGPAELAVQAEGHVPRIMTVELEGGVFADFTVQLTPLGRTFINVRDAGGSGGVAYQGALYLGPAPLAAELPAGNAGFFRVEYPGGGFSSTVVPAGLGEGSYGVSLPPTPPLPEGRTERARRQFYGAWGRFWVVMPLSLLVNGVAMSVINSYTVNPARTEEQYSQAQAWYWASMASDVLVILFAGESIFRAARYASASSRGEPGLERKF